MSKIQCLDEKFSTTRLLTDERPAIVKAFGDQFESILFLAEDDSRKGEGGLRTKGYFKKTYEDKPLISVITVVFNGEDSLEETIKSVINQTYNNVEYIIIDGGSTDGTLDIIKKYEDQVDYWVSEKDSGIYDAMNKGIRLAGDEWINFMNAGDFFYDENVLNNIYREPIIYRDVDFIYSDTVFDNKFVHTCDIKINSINHQSLIYRKKIHQTKGMYLVSKGLMISDYLFFMLSKDKNWYKSDVIIANYNTYGLSSQNFSLHFRQKIGTDLLFNHIGIKKAGIFLLVYPYYYNFRKMIINILTYLGLRSG